MKWSLVKLLKGDQFPEIIYWPKSIDAFVPIACHLSEIDPPAFNRDHVELFAEDIHTEEIYPFVWRDQEGNQHCLINIDEWIDSLKNELYRQEHKKPISALLPFHYHRVPKEVRNSIASFFVKVNAQAGAKKSMFPISYFNGGCELFISVCQKRWGLTQLPKVVLTHDIDSKEGFSWIDKMVKIEESHGFRSSWNVVPKHYRLNRDILNKLIQEGHEIGLHGIWHNNHEAFLNEKELRKQLDSLSDFIKEFSIKGYRSPSWFKTCSMFKVLADYFAYDLSCLDNDLICPAGHGGVGFMRPFKLKSGLVELPCTLPFEVPLFSSTKPEDLLSFWKEKIDFIYESNGLLLVNTHPDPNYSGNELMLKAYGQLLEYLSEKKWECQLPKVTAAVFHDLEVTKIISDQ